MEEERPFTGDFALCSPIRLFCTAVLFMPYMGTPLHAADEFGVGETEAGLAASAFTVGDLTARAPIGNRPGHCGMGRVMAVGVAAGTAASPPCSAASDAPQMCAARIVHGITCGAATSAYDISLDPSCAVGPAADGASIGTTSCRENHMVMASAGLLSMPVYPAAHGKRVRRHPGAEAE